MKRSLIAVLTIGLVLLSAGNTLMGAIAGAAIGGAAGAFIGRHMDKQAKEMRRDLEGAKVERIGEGIKITFDSGLMFDVNKHDLRPASRENLAIMANNKLKRIARESVKGTPRP